MKTKRYYCDKYGFKALKAGESRRVEGVEPFHAQQCFAKYKQRYPEMRSLKFRWWEDGDGTVVERVK
jgi:hypothetical protein